VSQLTEFRHDFGDGRGVVSVYGRRANLREQKAIAEHKKIMVSFDEKGDKVQTVLNAEEWLTHVFLILAKDADGMRLFMSKEDQDEVWTKFNPAEVFGAAAELLSLEDVPGN